jgi:hypothetical protein
MLGHAKQACPLLFLREVTPFASAVDHIADTACSRWHSFVLSGPAFAQANLEARKPLRQTLNYSFLAAYIVCVTGWRLPFCRAIPDGQAVSRGRIAPRFVEIGPKEGARKRMGLPLNEVWRHVRLDKLHISGELGIRDDAFWTVLFAGALCALLQSAMVYVCAEKKQSALEVRIAPAFTMDCLRLNLEGIAGCPPIHIISAIMIWHLKNRRGKGVWHILSKTS